MTDLVKVFLFKSGHRAKYVKLGAESPEGYSRERFEELAMLSLPWLEREISVASPRLVVTLGSEVAGILREVRSQKSRNELLGGTPSDWSIGEHTVKTVHLAHPGILMRTGDAARNPWPDRHNKHLKELRNHLLDLELSH